jgi:integral membrane sensor domain MASE1
MEKSEISKTINALVLVALVAFLLFHKKSFHHWFLGIAIGLLIINIFIPPLALFIATYWEKFGKVMGGIMSKIILTIAFYLFFTPLAFIYRTFNKPLVDYFKNRKKDTFYKDVTVEYTQKTFKNLW